MYGIFTSAWFRSVTDQLIRSRRRPRRPSIRCSVRRGRAGGEDVFGRTRTRLEPLELRVLLAATISGTIDETGEKDFYSFSLAQDARYYFDNLVNDSNLRWSLDGPRGSEVDNRPFNSSDSFDISNPVLNLVAGDYTVTIDGTGDTANTPYAFRLFDLRSAINITPGNAVTGALNPAKESDAYKFDVATAGDTFDFDMVSVTGGLNGNWRLIDPFSNVVFSSNLQTDQNNITLSRAGTYTLLLESRFNDTQGTNYTFNVMPDGNVPQPPLTGTPLTLGATTSGNIAAAGEVDNFLFTLATSSRLVFDSLTQDNNLRWSLVGPPGTVVSNRSFQSSDSNDFGGSPALNLPAGTYQLAVSATGTNTGAYSFRLHDVAAATPYTPGTTLSGTLNPAVETQRFRFSANAGDRVFVDVLDDLSGGGVFRILDTFGQQISFSGSDVDTFVLPQTGTYTLLVEGRIFAGGGTQTYSINVQPSTISTTPLTLGNTVNGSIGVAGESDRFTFTLAGATDVIFDTLQQAAGVAWSLVGPQGAVVSNRAMNSSDSNDLGGSPVLALPAGSYTLTVDGQGDTLATNYSFRLLDRAAAAAYTPGNLLSGTLTPPTQMQLFNFNATAGQRFFLDVTDDLSAGGVFRLINPLDQQIVFSGSDVETVTATVTGTYTLAIDGRIFAAGANQSFGVVLQPVIDGVGAMTVGTTVNGAIDEAGERDLYTFTLASLTNVVFDTLLNAAGVTWSLAGPGGAIVSNRAMNSSDSNDFGSAPVLALPAGSYTLTVDGQGDTLATNYSFRLLDLATAAPITPGTPVTGTLTPPVQTQHFRFTGTAGDRVFFDVTDDLTAGGLFRVLDTFGQQVLFSGSDVDTFVLPQTGTYTVLVEGRVFAAGGSQTFGFNVQPSTISSTPLALNTTTNGTITVAGESDHFTFTLAAPARLVFDSLVPIAGVTWSLTGPAGAVVSNRATNASDANDFGADPVLSLPAGDYTLAVDGQTDTLLANYSFRLLNLATVGTAFTPGVVQNGTLNPGTRTDVFTFTANAGDVFNFDSQTAGFNGTWRLIDTFGNQQFFGGLSDVNNVQVTQTGTYTLLVEGRIFQAGNQNYTFNVAPQGNTPIAPFAGTAYTLGSAVSGSISAAGEQDDFVFTLGAPARLYFDNLLNSSNIRWTLDGPRGTEVSNRGMNASDSFDVTNPVLDLVAGQYRLRIDASGTNTGAYSFALRDLATATAITPGTPVVGAFTDPREADFYSFSGTAGQKMFFDIQARTGTNNASWRLIDPFNNVVFNAGFANANNDVDTLVLPRTGNYLLLVEGRFNDTAAGTYTFNVQPVVDGGPTAVTLGATVNGAIDETGEQDVYTFALAGNARLLFDSLVNNNDLRWSLAGPRGTEVSNRNFNASDSFDVTNPVLNLVAGSYTLTVDATGDTAAPYAFRLLDMAAATPLTPGTPVSDSLGLRETRTYRFNGTAGESFFFDTVARTGAANASWRLIDAFDNVVFNAGFANASSDVETLALPTTGTYTLLLESRFNDTTAGTYTINVQPVSDGGPTAITIGNVVSGTIDEAGEQDVYTFTLAGDARLYFDSLTNNNDLRWSLAGPRGTEVSNRNFNSSDSFDISNPVIDLVAGEYTLRVDGTGDTAGAPYSFRLFDFAAATPVTPGTPVVGTLNPANESDLYRFTANAGDLFFFDLQAKTGSPNASWRLIDAFNNVIFSAGFNNTNSDVDTLALPTSGTFTLLIEGRFNDSGAASGTYTFNVQPVINGTPIAIDNRPNVTIADAQVTEGTGGLNNLVFTVTLSDTFGDPVEIFFSTADGTAMAPGDYTSFSGSIVIQPGNVTGQISVPIGTDSEPEGSETFLLNLTSATNAFIIDPQATGTIVDDDQPLNNQPPVNSVPGAQNLNEDATLTFSAANGNLISISDPDAGSAPVQVTLTAGNGTVSLSGVAGLTFSAGDGTADASMTFTGTIAAINTALAGMTFAPTPNFNGAASLTIATNDQGNTGSGGAQSDTDVINIAVAAVNDPPVNTVPGTQTIAEDAVLTFSSGGGNLIAVADVDAGGVATLQVTLTASNGTVSLDGVAGLSFSVGDGTADASMTFTGTLASINAALDGMSFTPAADFSGSAQISITSNDQGNSGAGGAQSDTDNVSITVTAENDAPVNTVPGTQSINEGATLTFNAANANLISVADVDAGSGQLQVTLAVTNGTLSLSGVSGLSFTTGDGTADTNMVFTGTLTSINAALNGMTFTPTGGFSGAATLTITTNDQGNSGAGGARSDTDAVTISVGSINDPPVNTVPASVATDEDTPLVFTGGNTISVADPDAGSAPIQVTLTVTNGTLSLSGVSGLSFTTGDGTTDSTMTFTGTLASINAALAGMTYVPIANFNGPAQLTITSNDLGNTGSGGAMLDTDNVSITVNAVNDAPVNTVPGPQSVNEDTTLVFSAANGNAVSVADIDAGASPVQVTLAASNGTITLASVVGLSFTSGDGSGDTTMVFTGTLANINAALNGLSFTPTAHFAGAAQLSITTSDQGATGSGGAQSDSDTVAITVNPVNDPPVNSVPGAQSVNEGQTLVFNAANANLISIADIDAGGGSLQVTLGVTNGTLTLSGVSGLSFSTGDGTADATMVFTGTLANINAALNGLSFAPTGGFSGTATLTITTNDQGNTGAGGALSDTDNVSISVGSINDPPVNTVPASVATDEDTPLVFTGGNTISVADPDAGASPIQVTLTVTNGALTLSGTSGLSFTTGDGSADATMIFTGTLASINAALAGMSYLPNANFNGPAQLTITSNDQGATGSGGPMSDTDVVPITVNAVNDPPVNIGPDRAVFTNEDTPLSFAGANAISVADPDAGTSPLQVSLTVTNGLLSLSGTAGLSFSTGDGSADATMTFTGTLAAINAALAGMTYTPNANFNGAAQLTMTSNDQGNAGSGGAMSDTDNFAIDVVAVNDAPVNSVPAAQSTPLDTPLVFNTANANLISVADVDAASGALQITLGVTNGTLTLGSLAGLSFTSGDGSADAGMVFTGTLAAVNAALSGLSFTPTAGFAGPAVLTLTTSDQGNTGAGGAMSDTDTVAINVVGGPALPTLSIGNASVTEGNAGTVAAVFTVTLSAPSLNPVTVEFTTADGSATVANGDYQSTSGTLTFAPGQTTQTITVLVNGDTVVEGNETFLLNLFTPANATIADGQGVGTILNDDQPPPPPPPSGTPRGKGWWANKHGQAQINDGGTAAPELALLRLLHLRNADGSHFDPTSVAQLSDFLRGAGSRNAAHGLSAHLAVLVLNVEAGFLSGATVIPSGGLLPAGITINQLIAVANFELLVHPTALPGDPWRAFQQDLRQLIEEINGG